MRPNRARDQSEAAKQQYQHHNRVKETRWLKIDMHVGNHAGKYEDRTGNGKQPAKRVPPAPEKNAHAKQHRKQGDPKSVRAVKVPIGAGYAHLIGQEVSSKASHNETNHEMAKATCRSSNITP